MASKTPKKSKQGAAKRVSTKTAKPRKTAKKGKARSKTATKTRQVTNQAETVKLLSGGNPQIPKGDGDAPVQAYIAAMPGWKQDIGRRIDAIIVQTVPHVKKAVKWNTPLYGNEGDGWFVSFHVFTRYVKVTFFKGTSLRPIPAGESRHKEVRYLDIYEDDFDEKQFADWVKQASQLPGEKL
jgi:hypothetical protein